MRTSQDNRQHYSPPAWIWLLSLILILIGAAGLAITFAIRPVDGWIWLVADFVFFAGVANGVLAWAMIFRTSQTRWTPAINRLAQSCVAYIPVMALTLIALLAGVHSYLPWVTRPRPEVHAWLNVPFMVVRDVIGLGILWTLALLLTRWSLVADTKDRLTEREHYRINCVAVAGVFVYAFVSTIISYDFIMTLWPGWYSTVFGPYFFCTAVYASMAVLIILSAALRRPLGVEDYIGPKQFQDMGNLMLGFCLFDMGLFFAQYLTIWYENLPFETDFLIIRYYRGAWPYLGWAAFLIGYAIPFILLQSRHLKQHPRLITPVAVMALLGVALERYVLVVPSLAPGRLLLYWSGLLIPFAFVGTFILCIALFLRACKPVSSADAALSEIPKRKVLAP